MMSKLLKKNSTKNVARADKDEVAMGGLPDDFIVVLGNKNSKMFKNMAKVAKEMGLTPVGTVYGPARNETLIAQALADKKAR
ncbi:MAG: hypothetical protein J6V11_00720 [Alphaproteobacteria bacterium]|nr:hypothetical protein [Alphaproteobacteria bacterium]